MALLVCLVHRILYCTKLSIESVQEARQHGRKIISGIFRLKESTSYLQAGAGDEGSIKAASSHRMKGQ